MDARSVPNRGRGRYVPGGMVWYGMVMGVEGEDDSNE
jgi:hypothetical protein